jgi:hypothetical protein
MITNPALSACKKSGVREVFATVWGDNGQETNHFVILPGLQLFAEHGYADEISEDRIRLRFRTCTGTDHYDSIIDLKYMDEVPGVEPGNHYMANPSNEVLDLRYGGTSARIPSAIDRLMDFAESRVERLEELEAERLLFGNSLPDSLITVNSPLYHRIATASCLSE